MDVNQRVERTKDLVQKALADPSTLDRLTSGDLKGVAKMLVGTLIKVGQRYEEVELQLDRVTGRCLELSGGVPPLWSYAHQQEVELLHHFTEFHLVKDDDSWVVCGVETDPNLMRPLYEYDLADFGDTVAESHARLMAAHLRQTFLPRNVKDNTDDG